MIRICKLGQTENILRLNIRSTGLGNPGLTGKDHTSPGLKISTITDSEVTPVVYSSASSTIETITTLGTFQEPSVGKCRFKEVSAGDFPGLYEIQLSNARFNVPGSRILLVRIGGMTGQIEETYTVLFVDNDWVSEIADIILTREWSSITKNPGTASMLQALRKLRNRVKIRTDTSDLAVYKEDGTSVAYTQKVITDATLSPLLEVLS